MSFEESAKALISGEYSRRRGYLSKIITTWNQIAITGTIAIWAIVFKWGEINQSTNYEEVFCTQIAWAGLLSSILIGLWRLYVHKLDHGIVKLYPIIYLCERALIPKELCTIKTPDSKTELSKDSIINDKIKYEDVADKEFGYRGHRFIDVFAGLMILIFGIVTLYMSSIKGIVTFSSNSGLHIIGILVIINFLCIFLVITGFFRWRNKTNKWPVPE